MYQRVVGKIKIAKDLQLQSEMYFKNLEIDTGNDFYQVLSVYIDLLFYLPF